MEYAKCWIFPDPVTIVVNNTYGTDSQAGNEVNGPSSLRLEIKKCSLLAIYGII